MVVEGVQTTDLSKENKDVKIADDHPTQSEDLKNEKGSSVVSNKLGDLDCKTLEATLVDFWKNKLPLLWKEFDQVNYARDISRIEKQIKRDTVMPILHKELMERIEILNRDEYERECLKQRIMPLVLNEMLDTFNIYSDEIKPEPTIPSKETMDENPETKIRRIKDTERITRILRDLMEDQPLFIQ
jgi:hypothetical protein